MIAAPYSSILQALSDALGWERQTDGSPNLSDEQWHEAKRAVSLAVGQLWNRAFWRDLLASEERWFAADWDPGEVAAAGSIRFHRAAGRYYLCLQDAPATDPAQLVGGEWENIEGGWTEANVAFETGGFWDSSAVYAVGDRVTHTATGAKYQCIQAHANQQPPDSAYWGELVPFQPAIEKYASGLTPIGKIEGVYTANPKVYRGARRIDFVEQGDQIVLRSLERNSVWVRFMPPTPTFRGDVWSAGASYVPATIYNGTSGGATASSGIDIAIPGRAALRAMTRHVDDQVEFLDYLVVLEDGSGGPFVFRASATDADDLVDCLKPDDIDASSPGRWMRSINA